MLVQFPALAGYVSVLQSVQTGFVPTQPPIQCVQELLYGDKWWGHEADHLRPSSAEIENECSYAFTPSYSFLTITGQLKFAVTIYRRISLHESFSAGAHRNVNVQCYWNLVLFFFSQPEKLT